MACSSHRVSAWMGQFLDHAFKVPYLCLVEDPFDYTDNTARTVGCTVRVLAGVCVWMCVCVYVCLYVCVFVCATVLDDPFKCSCSYNSDQQCIDCWLHVDQTLIHWLILIDSLISALMHWCVEALMHSCIHALIDALIDLLMHWLILIDWCIDWCIDLIHWLMHWCIDALISGSTSTRQCRHYGTCCCVVDLNASFLKH